MMENLEDTLRKRPVLLRLYVRQSVDFAQRRSSKVKECCECDTDPSSSVRCGEFLERMREY